ncbi:unnamed protein product [Cladocopium goreaui]|uniref:Ubiquitin-conjugating enzyme E2 23 n=1 Tax=Cladocopium goreaui TaxID=2562237 RepID=A0A9P1FJ24_9DINO|nr:unnamed protein product [Cladocopium goreaui]
MTWKPSVTTNADFRCTRLKEILPSNGPRQGLSQLPPRVPVGVVQTVDLKARTAVVEWRCSHRESPQEVSLFELAPHPYFELRLGDIVFIPPYLVPEVGHWIGRVVQLQNFTVLVYLGNGTLAELPRDFNGGILDDFYWDER